MLLKKGVAFLHKLLQFEHLGVLKETKAPFTFVGYLWLHLLLSLQLTQARLYLRAERLREM
jgi:hypothetical protein